MLDPEPGTQFLTALHAARQPAAPASAPACQALTNRDHPHTGHPLASPVMPVAQPRPATLVARERAALVALLHERGPDATTCRPDWQARDLIADLMARERTPPGGPLAGLLRRASHAERSSGRPSFDDLVAQLARGPQFRGAPLNPEVDRLLNTAEVFTCHEDLRRARDPWQSRTFRSDDEAELGSVLQRTARVALAGCPVGMVCVTPDGRSRRLHRGRHRHTGDVRAHGAASEVLWWCAGRGRVAEIDWDGSAGALAAVFAHVAGAPAA